MPANLENSAVATGLEKVSFHSNPKERQCQRMLKLPHNCTHSHTSKVMLKILQARLQQYVNCEIPDVQADFRKGRGTRDPISNIPWIIKKVRDFQKSIYLRFIDYDKGFGIVNKAKVDVFFLGLSCFFNYPADVGSLISGSSVFSKISLNIWKFMVHLLFTSLTFFFSDPVFFFTCK